MKLIYPNYYENFKCIQSTCRHNCCIGWEIDIDPQTLSLYEQYPHIMAHIDTDPPHFILGEQERCPFLNADNLCEIICRFGEEALCDICASHPRFHNEFEDRTEIGLGLCCEAACRLILGQGNTVKFNGLPISLLAIHTVQNRQKPIGDRLPPLPDRPWAQILRRLERMDPTWGDMLDLLDAPQSPDFENHMSDRQTEYEQLAVYLLYRHNSIAFAAFGYHILHAIGAAFFHKHDRFTFEDQVELCRLFSCEIEYSEENLKTIFDLL